MAGTGQVVAYSIAFDGFNLTQHVGQSFNPNVAFADVHVAGRARRVKVIANNLSPVYSVPSHNLTTLLTQMSLKRPLLQANGASFFLQQREEADVYSSGANHYKLLTRKGALLITSLSVSDTEPAVASLDYHELWDGTNEMSVATAGESLGAAAPAYGSYFYRGTVRADGADFTNVVSVSIDTGMTVSKPTFGGDIGPRKLSLEAVDPIIDIGVASIADWPGKSMKVFGKNIATSLQVYFKKGDPDNMRVTGANSLLVSSAEGHITPSGFNAQGIADGLTHFLFRPTDELAINLAASHP